MLNNGVSSKPAETPRSIVTEVLKNSMVRSSDEISINTISSIIEASVALACDCLTISVGSVRCVVHTLFLCVNGVFTEDLPWQIYRKHINNAISYLSYDARYRPFH